MEKQDPFTLPFTNFSDEDFTARWGKVDYLFPSKRTVPMLGMIYDATPLETQHIRKRFAKDLAIREFGKSVEYKTMTEAPGTYNSIFQARTYTEDQLAPYIQQCLEPQPKATVSKKEVVTDPLEKILKKDDDGELITRAVKGKNELHIKTQKE